MISDCQIRLGAAGATSAGSPRCPATIIESGLGWRWTPARILAAIRAPDTNLAVACRSDRARRLRPDAVQGRRGAPDPAGGGRRLPPHRCRHARWWPGSSAAPSPPASAPSISRPAAATSRRARSTAGSAITRSRCVPGYYQGREDGVRIARDLWLQAGDPAALAAEGRPRTSRRPGPSHSARPAASSRTLYAAGSSSCGKLLRLSRTSHPDPDIAHSLRTPMTARSGQTRAAAVEAAGRRLHLHRHHRGVGGDDLCRHRGAVCRAQLCRRRRPVVARHSTMPPSCSIATARPATRITWAASTRPSSCRCADRAARLEMQKPVTSTRRWPTRHLLASGTSSRRRRRPLIWLFRCCSEVCRRCSRVVSLWEQGDVHIESAAATAQAARRRRWRPRWPSDDRHQRPAARRSRRCTRRFTRSSGPSPSELGKTRTADLLPLEVRHRVHHPACWSPSVPTCRCASSAASAAPKSSTAR